MERKPLKKIVRSDKGNGTYTKPRLTDQGDFRTLTKGKPTGDRYEEDAFTMVWGSNPLSHE